MPMRIGDPVPAIDGATDWMNGTAEDALEAFKGSPVLVHFWAVSCGICKEKMPQLRSLIEKYESEGLRTVAVHMPRYEADTDVDAVKEALGANGISEVCALDNQHDLKKSFQNDQGWVPVYYLFDSEGKLKTRAAGEFGVGVLKTALEKMFPEKAQAA